jgi:phosphoserine aminotransferase
MKPRGFNFGAGPGCLPEEVLKQAQAALWNWNDQGMSVLEVGFRTSVFVDLLNETRQLFKQVLNIPEEFEILFFGGPARSHFSYIPLNILQKNENAMYVVSGTWSEMAYNEARRLLPTQVYLGASGKENHFIQSPRELESIKPDTKYVYFCPNETIVGLEYEPTGELASIPWIADMTSCILSEEIEFSKYGLIFAGAQKNVANAGLTLVIVRKEWIAHEALVSLPVMDDYRVYARENSLYATPPTFNIYMMNVMMKWVIAQGGIEYFAKLSQEKSQLLYDYLDQSKIYRSFVKGTNRSRMNVCFTTDDEQKDMYLVKKAEEAGLYSLKGHRSFGGLRASLYNAMPLEGVKKLIQFLDKIQFS